MLRQGHVFTVAQFVGRDEADIEDLFHPDLYAKILNGAFDLDGTKTITAEALVGENAGGTERLVKKAEVIVNRTLPPDAPEMSHYVPALWLIRNQGLLDGDSPEVTATLDRFEQLFAAFNNLL